MQVIELIKLVLRILLAAVVVIGVVAAAMTLMKGMDYTRSVWRTISSPFSGILGSPPKHDLKTSAKEQQPAQAVVALATMMAYDSLCEIAPHRPRVMREMGLVALRIQAESRGKPDTPVRTIPAIVQGAETWLPENWDPSEKSIGPWYQRELDRMRERVTEAELVDARLIAEQIIGANPGAGPIRYTRPPPCTLRQRAVRAWSNEKNAAAQVKATMDLDTDLGKLGIKTGFYRRRTAR